MVCVKYTPECTLILNARSVTLTKAITNNNIVLTLSFSHINFFIWVNTCTITRHGFLHIASEALISKAVNERAQKAREQDEAEIVDKRHICLRQVYTLDK